jgi:hypothetical protein
VVGGSPRLGLLLALELIQDGHTHSQTGATDWGLGNCLMDVIDSCSQKDAPHGAIYTSVGYADLLQPDRCISRPRLKFASGCTLFRLKHVLKVIGTTISLYARLELLTNDRSYIGLRLTH